MKPEWLKPHNGCIAFPVLVHGKWYGYVKDKWIEITKEYEAYSAKMHSKLKINLV